MTNQESYIQDLNKLRVAIRALVCAVPAGKTKLEKSIYENVQEIGDSAEALISCMENDYIPIEME